MMERALDGYGMHCALRLPPDGDHQWSPVQHCPPLRVQRLHTGGGGGWHWSAAHALPTGPGRPPASAAAAPAPLPLMRHCAHCTAASSSPSATRRAQGGGLTLKVQRLQGAVPLQRLGQRLGACVTDAVVCRGGGGGGGPTEGPAPSPQPPLPPPNSPDTGARVPHGPCGGRQMEGGGGAADPQEPLTARPMADMRQGSGAAPGRAALRGRDGRIRQPAGRCPTETPREAGPGPKPLLPLPLPVTSWG